MSKDRILLIDGLNFLYRGKIKFGKPVKVNGFEYTIVYNFFRNLRALIQELQPTKVFFVLEGHPAFRYALLPTYKANRIVKNSSKQNHDQDFDRQRDVVIDLLQYLPITLAKADNYEADDTINGLVENLKSIDDEILIVSGDKDYIQIIQKYNTIKLYNSSTKEFVQTPSYHFLAMLCLAGDTSDNIDGLIGEQKAIKLASTPKELSDFLTVDENRNRFNLNKELIEFKSPSLNEIKLTQGTLNLESLKNEFRKFEFKSVVDEPYWEKFSTTFTKLA